MDKQRKEGGNGKRDGLDSEPSVSPFDAEKGKICSRFKVFCSARKPAIVPPTCGGDELHEATGGF